MVGSDDHWAAAWQVFPARYGEAKKDPENGPVNEQAHGSQQSQKRSGRRQPFGFFGEKVSADSKMVGAVFGDEPCKKRHQ